MKVPFKTEDGKSVCILEMSSMPGIDASFEVGGKFYKITDVEYIKDQYACTVKKINQKVYEE